MIRITIAILILVGFESCTAFAAETKNPRKNIPRAVVLSLMIKKYHLFFEYFAAGYMLGDKIVGKNAAGTMIGHGRCRGFQCAYRRNMAIQVGNTILHGIGFGLMITIAVTVAMAILGTTLSCSNTRRSHQLCNVERRRNA